MIHLLLLLLPYYCYGYCYLTVVTTATATLTCLFIHSLIWNISGSFYIYLRDR